MSIARHLTITAAAQRASKALGRVGILAYPGLMSPTVNGGVLRVTIMPEVNRVRVSVSWQGHQDLLLYGYVNPTTVMNALRSEFGEHAVTVQDTSGYWLEGR